MRFSLPCCNYDTRLNVGKETHSGTKFFEIVCNIMFLCSRAESTGASPDLVQFDQSTACKPTSSCTKTRGERRRRVFALLCDILIMGGEGVGQFRGSGVKYLSLKDKDRGEREKERGREGEREERGERARARGRGRGRDKTANNKRQTLLAQASGGRGVQK